MDIDDPLQTSSLRKLLLVSTGELDAPTGRETRAAMDCVAHVWEWIELVASSPAVPALDAARSLHRAVLIDPRFGTPARLRGPEMRAALAAHAREGLARLDASGADAALVVTDGVYFAALWSALGAPALAATPGPGEIALITRRADGSWRAGRTSSDPAPLRSALENGCVVDPCSLVREPLRHVAPLQLAGFAAARSPRGPRLGDGPDA